MNPFHHALKIDKELCIGCTHCMKVCPTQALRVTAGKAVLLDNRCVDCGECFRACPVSAIRIEEDDFAEIFNFKHRIALVPSVLISQFPEGLPPEQIYSTLLEIGFTDVFEVEHAVDMLQEEMVAHQQKLPKDQKPAISTFCPAIVRLIQVKFPSLTQNMMLLKPPFDIAAIYYRKLLEEKGYEKDEIGLFYITPCAAKIAAVKSPVGEKHHLINGVINTDSLYNKLLHKIKNNKSTTCRVPVQNNLSATGIRWSLTKGESDVMPGRNLAIDGIQNVMKFLERLENEEISGIDFLELRACDESCAGGVLNVNNRFLTVEQMEKRAATLKKNKNDKQHESDEELSNFIRKKMKLVEPIKPRSIEKLDDDMLRAMQKMREHAELMKVLPLIDCGACGTPSCDSLAEDIVNEKASMDHCLFIQSMKVYEDADDKEEAKARLEEKWGKNRINTYRHKK